MNNLTINKKAEEAQQGIINNLNFENMEKETSISVPENSDGRDQNNKEKTESDKSSTKKLAEKDYMPKYTNEKEEHLKAVTATVEREVEEVLNDEGYAAESIAKGRNAYIDIKAFVLKGGILARPSINRTHGKDEDSTYNSIMTDGAQHPFIVVTAKMAEVARIDFERFSTDTNKSDEPIPAAAKVLVVIDGNGRANKLLSIDHEMWPEVGAVLPSKNRAGYYDIPTCMTKINTEIAKWKTQDFIQKEIMEDRDGTHEGFLFINRLVREGYGYQSACQLATLGTDRIQKPKINGSYAKDVFDHYESAKKIYNKLKSKFVEDESPLKTKEFTKEVSIQWRALQKRNGDDFATKHYLDFLEDSLTDDLVKKIQSAKSESTKSGKVSKDEVRKNILQKAFYQFSGKNNIKID